MATRVTGPVRRLTSRESHPPMWCSSPPPWSPLISSVSERRTLGSGATAGESIDGLLHFFRACAEAREHLRTCAVRVGDECEEQIFRRDRTRSSEIGGDLEHSIEPLGHGEHGRLPLVWRGP